MCESSARDRREAIPSWHGYDYQGRVAIVVALEILNEIKNNPDKITAYDLAIEDIEDFAIYYSGELRSIHQVKARANRNLTGYNEALYMLAKGITNRKDVQAYLHNSVSLDFTDWEIDLGRSLRLYCASTKDELLAKLEDEEKLKEYIKSLQKGITKNNTIDKRIDEERKALLIKIIEIDGGLDHHINLSLETVRPAIESYIADLGNENIICSENLSRIKLYRYNQSEFFLDTDNVGKVIEDSIIQYWGKEAEFKVPNVVSYRIKLQELITEHIRKRYSNPAIPRISLQRFSEILDSILKTDGAMRLLIQKDKLSSFRQSYCHQECHRTNDNCNGCDLLKKTALLEVMDFREFGKACYALCPQTTDNVLQKDATELITEPGTWECMFPVLQNVKREAELNHCRIVYDIDVQFYMLTALYFSRIRESHILKNLCNNETVDELFSSVCKNSESGLIFREIDYMIISSDYELENTELEKYNPSIFKKGHLAGWTPSYSKITGPKEVHLIKKDTFLERCSEVQA
ncbi:ABC-three component system protein [Desulfitobacterium metallireducens]|uniref:ABC-three component systems C-terminal domain-containing protein n=1 Tax=Desulfitobacterium metallireducens DSM 15288 TaxID=871968 RepID=W0EFT1_9FIRM|nr:ABC-three component system protein [Desulfitobacterium metallireducens]AHF08368.1 hypothetical protein DESME_01000 [Desulfitobacterium metallireducens DSM 15288]